MPNINISIEPGIILIFNAGTGTNFNLLAPAAVFFEILICKRNANFICRIFSGNRAYLCYVKQT